MTSRGLTVMCKLEIKMCLQRCEKLNLSWMFWFASCFQRILVIQAEKPLIWGMTWENIVYFYPCDISIYKFWCTKNRFSVWMRIKGWIGDVSVQPSVWAETCAKRLKNWRLSDQWTLSRDSLEVKVGGIRCPVEAKAYFPFAHEYSSSFLCLMRDN